MSFDGTKESCPNYDSGTNELDMSWVSFGNPFSQARNDPQYGKTNFNKTCFNICATKNDDDSDKGPTYIENGMCMECLDEEGDLNDPREGTKRYLINDGKFEMCNVPEDTSSGSVSDGDGMGMVWFNRQQDANLLAMSRDPDNSELFQSPNDSLTDFSSLLSGLQYDSTFEACVNDKLNTPGSNDLDVQERISKYTSIKEFRSEDINYLKKKLRKIITIKTNDVNECMDLLNLGSSICQTGVADKTMMIGALIFKIIGNDKINIMESSNDEKYKMNQLIDEIGPLIPRAVKNIIHVSKEYETRVCNTPSNTTLLLERLYDDLYDKQTHVTLDISPYIDFDSLIETKDTMHFIKKITVLVVFAYLFMHATNLVVAFLSRGQSITKIA